VSNAARISRRTFLAGASTTAVVLGLRRLDAERIPASASSAADAVVRERITPKSYGDWSDVYRDKWTWDRIAKGTHTRANCIANCAWDIFVKDGVVWREEQASPYEAPNESIPDMNPRGCQKGACYSDLQVSGSRVLYPLKRVGERGSGKWRRLSWEEAIDEITEVMLDAAVEHGTETVVYDNGTTNAGMGPESMGEMRFAGAFNATIMDSWSGVGDMPMGAVQTWGMYNSEGTSDDWFRSDYIVVWVGNPNYTRIPEIHFMHEARYRGGKLVVIAPDYSPTAVHADLWLNPKMETDAALGLAAAQVILSEGLHKAEYVREQTDLPILVREDNGRFLRESDLKKGGAENRLYFWDEAKNRLAVVPGCEGDGGGGRSLALGDLKPALAGRYPVKLADGKTVEVRPVFEGLREQLERDYTPEKAAKVTGLKPALIRRFARELAAAPSAMIFASWGACKHHHSDLFQRAMILLMALTGNQGKAGGGLRVAAWWGMDGLEKVAPTTLSLGEKLRVIPKAIRGLTARDYEDLFVQVSEKEGNMPLMPFLYVHGGYRELWSKPHLNDPDLPRGIDEYVRQAVDRGWLKVHPPEDRPPQVYLYTGCNPLRRWPAPQTAKQHLWPKLKCIVSVNFRMNTTGMYSDYILPAAGYYEKHGIKYTQSYSPYIILSDEAVRPLGESLSEWVIFAMLADRIASKAKERNLGPVRGLNDRPLDLSKVYDIYTANGHYDPYDPKDPVKVIDDVLRGSDSLEPMSGEEALRKGAVRVIGTARPSPIYASYSDYDPNDTYWPHQYFVKDKMAWPTLTGRQQFYLDHEWYLEAGEALPVHKEPPATWNGKYPLRVNGGHTRWSIHAIWRDHDLMLRLERGEPVCFMSPVDTRPRGIGDGDRVRVFNQTGEFEAMVKVTPSAQPGEVIIYHAWEPHQFKGWKGQQDPVAAPWKPIHLAGGYSHLHYRMFYGSPGHGPRGAAVEVERVRATAASAYPVAS
jgi:DMSO reductase family type II enzyme molybdopterin subunit